MEIVTYDFTIRGDERGSLIAIEENKDVPFPIKRIYYIFDVHDEATRGMHAHKTLRQVLVCVKGSCKILLDDGYERKSVALSEASRGLLVNVMVWHEMYDFSSDCVLLALASDFYDENDYIRDYPAFLELANAQGK
ncbi:MAG TPA: FdtA/QdtA family cupin domain-containing protein [Syntrophomonadaceae bacterium]|nr:FdtA/QdtA family cupin domain-containing protein [Syntrophomonadaceae bacterium]